MAVLASAIMDRSAAFLNDVNKTLYSYANQLPYLKSAYDRLQMYLQMNGALTLKDTSSVIDVDANATEINPPSDLVSIIEIKERERDSTDLWADTKEVDELPEMDPVDNIQYWMWEEEKIKIIAPLTNREVKVHYYKSATAINSESSSVSILNSTEYLALKTAALCAKYIGENLSRAAELEAEAREALGLMLNIDVKSRQGFGVRQKPYGAGRREGPHFFIR